MKLCLVMIVKDEEKVIERCLRSVLPIIGSAVIVDTGSTDRTKDVIRGFFDPIKFPYTIEDKPWVNFGHNRSESARIAAALVPEAYALMIDADDTLEIHGELPELTADYYDSPVRCGNLRYLQPHVFRLDKPFYFKGATHEYLTCDSPVKHGGTLESFTYHIGNDGYDRARGTKLTRDIALLEQELKYYPNDPRTLFYLAQSYRDLGNYKTATYRYAQRIRVPGWIEETFSAHLELAKCLERVGEEYVVIEAYLNAFEARPTRAEPLYWLARYLRSKGRHALAYVYATYAASIKQPADKLFVETDVYEWKAADECAINAFYVGDLEMAKGLNDDLLVLVPSEERSRILKNQKHVLAALEKVG